MLRIFLPRNTAPFLLSLIIFTAMLLVFHTTTTRINSDSVPKGVFIQQQAVRVPNGKPDLTEDNNNINVKRSEIEEVGCVNIEVDEVDSARTHHVYKDDAQLRVVVLTHRRFKSLHHVLESLQGLVLDGHNATMEIWVDRDKENRLDGDTYRTARSFCWDRGPVFVHIHSEHVGLYGQWIQTWQPKPSGGSGALGRGEEELAIFIEDDVDVSMYAYRWLRHAHRFYGEHEDISGYSLQDENVKYAKGKKSGKELSKRGKGLVYMFPVAGSWGFAPHPARWAEFLNWYAKKSQDKKFKPYVADATLHTNWYKTFEKKNAADTMWTIWFIRFCFEHSLYSIYSNIPTHLNVTEGSFMSNRKESGLHYTEKKRHMYKIPKLLHTWRDAFVQFPPYEAVKKYDYDGAEAREPIKLEA